MQSYICTTCGVAYAPSDGPPDHCPICADERQYVNPNGQSWTTQEELRSTHRNELRELEPSLTGIGTVPQVAIGQRALWIAASEGGVMWDSTPLVSDDAVAAIKAKGGLRAIAISHPHFYSAMTEWSRRLGDVPIYLHADDSAHVMDPSPSIRHWSGESHDLGGGVTLIRCGGHFSGSTALHWAGGAGGKGALFSSDTVMVNPDALDELYALLPKRSAGQRRDGAPDHRCAGALRLRADVRRLVGPRLPSRRQGCAAAFGRALHRRDILAASASGADDPPPPAGG